MARTNSLEGGSDETTVTNGNSGGTSGTAFTSPTAGTGATVVFDNAQAHLGSFSCRTSTGGTSALAYTNWTWTAKSEDYCRAHYRFASLPSAQQVILRYLNAGSQCLRVNVTTSGTIEVRNAANSVVGTTSATITAATWFRIELHVTASTTVGAIEMRFYASANSSTPTETLNLTSLVLTANVDEVRFGIGSAMANAVQVWHDAVGADHTAFFGPAVVGGTAAIATTITRTVVGTRTVLGTVASATTCTAAAVGTRTVLGTIQQTQTFTVVATGTRTVLGTVAAAPAFGATATGTRSVLGVTAPAFGVAVAAVGTRIVPGTVSRPIAFTAAAAGTVIAANYTPGVLAASAPTADLATAEGRSTLTATASRTATLTATTSP